MEESRLRCFGLDLFNHCRTATAKAANSQPKSSHEAWEFLKNLFLDNACSKIIELTVELRSLNIFDMTTEAYFRKIDTISSMLTNLGSTIKDEELVTYAINGLNDRFPYATHIILHRSPFSDLTTVRSMITLEDMQLQRKNHNINESQGTSSSPTVLIAQANHSNPTRYSNNAPEVCRNFSRGKCRFGGKCHYLHHVANGIHPASRTEKNLAPGGNNPNRTTSNTLAQLLNIIAAQQNLLAQEHLQQAHIPSASSFGPRTPLAQPQAQVYGVNLPGQQQYTSGPSQLFPGTLTTNNTTAYLAAGPAQFASGPSQASPYVFNAQPTQQTVIPSTFSTATLPDYGNTGWIVDTGASIHLTSSINNLSTVFNHCIYPSIPVSDGNSIPITNIGHSVLPNINRALHLSNVLVTPNIVKNLISVRKFARDNKVSVSFDEFGFSVKDYLTRRLLLRCDSTRDLYLLTPQTSTTAYQALLTSPTIWHQRLGHPSTDVFRRLISNNSIACNNTKSPVLCHACQLGKHVRLPFGNSVSLIYRASVIGIDCDETFSTVVKSATIQTVLSLAISRHWPVHQLDVKNSFLHMNLSETVYMHQPPGFWDPDLPYHVCLLHKSLYGLKQTPRAWFQRFAGYAQRVGFQHSICDSSLFIYKKDVDIAYLLLYVDDSILTASTPVLLQQFIASLHKEFSMTDLGPINYFLGISVHRKTSGMFLSQKKYATEILERADMASCNPCRTPVDTSTKLTTSGPPVQDPTLYRSVAWALQYLTFTRPDISYAVQQICLFMHDPREPHLAALRRILSYIQGTIDLGLQLHASSTTSLLAYSDADWAGCPTTRRSTSGYYVFLGDNLLSWSTKRQLTPSRSSAEAEYKGVANVVAGICWLRNLLCELHCPLTTATIVYYDNVNAVYMSGNPVQHQRTKYIEIDIYFVRDLVLKGHVRVLHVPSQYQYADIFTKGLPTTLFDDFRTSLSVRSAPAPTVGGF
ncbi:uncharacterized protein [Rutidosis leptorrhynchoides]|uniref:uncharacterized protein n=1 Tax=Rutidosis leptorrhynchoides TaxID=125765 RepID=UPI003A993012